MWTSSGNGEPPGPHGRVSPQSRACVLPWVPLPSPEPLSRAERSPQPPKERRNSHCGKWQTDRREVRALGCLLSPGGVCAGQGAAAGVDPAQTRLPGTAGCCSPAGPKLLGVVFDPSCQVTEAGPFVWAMRTEDLVLVPLRAGPGARLLGLGQLQEMAKINKLLAPFCQL